MALEFLLVTQIKPASPSGAVCVAGQCPIDSGGSEVIKLLNLELDKKLESPDP